MTSTEPGPTATPSEDTIRVGSPFRGDSESVAFVSQVIIREAVLHNPGAYMAVGAVSASSIVLPFGLLAAWWYPAGGLLVASLGCALSLTGLFSRHRYVSLVLLVAHLATFLGAVSRSGL